MSTFKKIGMIGALLMSLSIQALGADMVGEIQLKTGEMGFLSFLEMVSDRLNIQVNASGLEVPSKTVVVPNSGPLSLDRAKALVLSTLYLQGYTWVHDSATDVYRIMHQRDARDQETPMIADSAQLPDSDLLVTYFMKIEHVSPDYIARILRSFMPANSRIIPEGATNSVLITDSARNILKLKKLIKQVDTPETAKHSANWLNAWSKKMENNCPDEVVGSRTFQPGILIVLFSLIALVIGFLIRGYVIRRIEGGL